MMRKYIVGFMVGLLFASAFPVYGAVTSMIGKKVQAENKVEVNGKSLDVTSVNIGGTTYAPNRAIADALGMDIKFENNTVVFSSKEKAGDTVTTQTPNDQLTALYKERDQLSQKILDINLKRINDPSLQQQYDQLMEQAKQLQQKIEELEAQSTPTP